jgi:hypothetical protein
LPRRGQKKREKNSPAKRGIKKEIKTNFKRIFMQNETPKKIKMQYLHRPSVKSSTGYKRVPWLTVSGIWLEQAGFNIGSIVEIITSENQLIIRKENEYEQLTDY